MKTAQKVHRLLELMIEAYAEGDADDDLQGFLAGWATTIRGDDESAAEKQEVLIRGDFTDGFTVEGPYPQGLLDDEGITDSGPACWIAPLAEPTLRTDRPD